LFYILEFRVNFELYTNTFKLQCCRFLRSFKTLLSKKIILMMIKHFGQHSHSNFLTT